MHVDCSGFNRSPSCLRRSDRGDLDLVRTYLLPGGGPRLRYEEDPSDLSDSFFGPQGGSEFDEESLLSDGEFLVIGDSLNVAI